MPCVDASTEFINQSTFHAVPWDLTIVEGSHGGDQPDRRQWIHCLSGGSHRRNSPVYIETGNAADGRRSAHGQSITIELPDTHVVGPVGVTRTGHTHTYTHTRTHTLADVARRVATVTMAVSATDYGKTTAHHSGT